MRLTSSLLPLLLCAAAAALPAQTKPSASPRTATALAATPPMGWNSWNWFAGKVTDKDVRQAADLLVSSGMRDAGYVYVNIDDTWEGKRDAQGVLHTNEKFPDMKALADYIHSKGLKIGIYSSPGPTTCAKYEGSYQHEQQDADLYAGWGIDYLKYDLCGFRKIMNEQAPNDMAKQYTMMRDAYAKMHEALLKTGRPIFYSLCQYGYDSVWDWGPTVGANSWRTTGDIDPTFDRMSLIGREQAGLARFASPGHWNDPDMLEVGNGKLKPSENRLHMTLWAMLAAPLLAGNNLSQMTPDTVAVLTDKEIIAINQDTLGKQAGRILAEGPIEVWSRPLSNGDTAVALFNFNDSVSDLRGIAGRAQPLMPTRGKAHEIWTGKDLPTPAALFAEPIPGHSVRIVRISR